MTTVQVHGAGPAGSSAAVAALLAGAEVDLYDPSPFPRQKVCGEFLSPEALPILEALGVAREFAALGPATYRELVLRIGSRAVRARLPTPAYGLSRYALDHLLLNRALSLGARLHRERATADSAIPTVVATGRPGSPSTPRGSRLFGFKAHFRGTPSEPLSLNFSGPVYVGINAVEGGGTNVCGLAPEDALQRHSFVIDDFLYTRPNIFCHIQTLSRSMPWLLTGPLVYDQRFQKSGVYRYPAGDTLSFVDPFTGSGLLSALLTGRFAGLHAAQNEPVDAYLERCRAALRRPFLIASIFRAFLATPLAGPLAACIPVTWMIQGTRPAEV